MLQTIIVSCVTDYFPQGYSEDRYWKFENVRRKYPKWWTIRFFNTKTFYCTKLKLFRLICIIQNSKSYCDHNMLILMYAYSERFVFLNHHGLLIILFSNYVELYNHAKHFEKWLTYNKCVFYQKLYNYGDIN